jgi:hypothetical protein
MPWTPGPLVGFRSPCRPAPCAFISNLYFTNDVLWIENLKFGWVEKSTRKRGRTYLNFLDITFLEDLLDDVVGVLGTEFILKESI